MSEVQGIKIESESMPHAKDGPIADHQVGPCLAFQFIAVDLSGPIEYQGTTKKRQTGKGRGGGFMFVCTTTSAFHVEFVELYCNYSFLMEFRRYMCLRGTPS
jgi:hypothetical protein